ncbi:hypothetical protein QQP08_007584 [Theobroma cacao]|nr:hypothetical protein QQP08_007584 [Theobroma cacao]
MFLSIRKVEIRLFLLKLWRDSHQGFAKVELRLGLMDLAFNNITRMVAGKQYYKEDIADEGEASRFCAHFELNRWIREKTEKVWCYFKWIFTRID